ncbi:MAG: hypothetical protein NT144_08485 [Bacteroidia bacterium]|nr:hypothetical protein [Bacteroidia bacterium]
MKKYEGRLIGILGTVIIHLIAGIIFMSFQIKSLQRNLSDEFEVEFAPVVGSQIKEKLIELPATTIERILKGDDEMLNIARNLANKSEEKIDPADYIDMVKEELIKSGKLGIDNYIDEQKRLDEMKADEKLTFENDTVNKNESDKPKESQKMAANYKGPTRIYYYLADRNHTYLPIPIYKCQGSGKVVLSIDVNQKGVVEKALVIADESTTSDPCLVETAVATALISRFNSDLNSPKIQTGTLSYQFVAQ